MKPDCRRDGYADLGEICFILDVSVALWLESGRGGVCYC